MDSIPRCNRILRKIVLVISQKKKDKKKKNGESKNIWEVFKLAINTIRMINSVIFKDIFYKQLFANALRHTVIPLSVAHNL